MDTFISYISIVTSINIAINLIISMVFLTTTTFNSIINLKVNLNIIFITIITSIFNLNVNLNIIIFITIIKNTMVFIRFKFVNFNVKFLYSN